MTMANYQRAFSYMIVNEDSTLSGKVETDNDGGKVRFGLNSNAHPQLLSNGFYELTTATALDVARSYYQEWYWAPVKGQLMHDQDVANKVFDQSVPMGIHQVGKIVQRTLNAMEAGLEEDGVIGPLTMNALNNADPSVLLQTFKTALDAFYHELVEIHPEWQDELVGWLNRANK